MILDDIERLIARNERRHRRRRAVSAWLGTFRRVFSLHAWRRCRDCGERLGWHGYTDHIPF